MNSSIKVKHLLVLAVVIGLGYFGYANRLEILGFIKSFTRSGAEKTVDSALAYLKDEKGTRLELFSVDYSFKLLSNYSFYKIEEWELYSTQKSATKYLVGVKGKTKNAFGIQLDREPVFVVELEGDQWKITDSYRFFVFEGLEEGYDETDMKKHGLMEEKERLLADLRQKCKVEKWSFEETYGDNVKGKGTIFNGGEIPVEYLKIEITYTNKKGQVVNTDDFYAVSSKLHPGQRRTFGWFTTNCYNCDRASIRMVFDRN